MSEQKEISLSTLLKDAPKNEAATIRKVAVVCCIVNAILMIGKFVFGYFGHSEALIADGFHSVYDVSTALIVFIFIDFAYRKADSDYTYGYGKFETFITFIMSMFLLAAAAMLTFEAVERIIENLKGEILPRPDLSTIFVAVIAIISKETLFRYTIKAGKRTGSSALVANAWHQRSDAMASVATLAGVTISYFCGEKWRIVDPIASLIIVVIIIIAAIHILKPAYSELMEKRLDDTTLDKARKAISSVPGVGSIVSLKSRKNGHTMIFDVTISLPSGTTIDKSHEITETIKDNLVKALCPHILLSVTAVPEKPVSHPTKY